MDAIAGFLAAPPISKTRFIETPNCSSASTASTSPHNIPSIIARAISAGFELVRFIPANTPVASGRLGVLSPSK
ncbi:unannotated protein [freshwater metagenome]|uniref:Unannotated protein n=1 Tax=freshwater metagenome TaxID=449393 RepID=A0A6J7B758_9ZZZZ